MMGIDKMDNLKKEPKNSSQLNPICIVSLGKDDNSNRKSVLDLKVGEVGYVKSFDNLDCACKLLTLGLLPKSRVTVVRKSPLGDALYLQLDGHKIAIRKTEGAAILIVE
ncbi:MAG: Fe2+ transport system protein FeoA [Saprospiraceae bacterium]|jgi:Fe2+ transport system protein FeoA|tara:strand:+ start:318 stop:644 length:327 start_codon:yes stop_codon:yes gene_type:complete